MKKILLILAVAITSCTIPKIKDKNVAKHITSKPLDYSVDGVFDLQVVTIESCEYFTYKTHGFYSIEHKGNCKNPIHYQTK
jgi:hypothetical protein